MENKNNKAAKKEAKPIDKVTVSNLDMALRSFGVNIDSHRLDLIIDLVELIEEKGDQTTISDLCKLDDERAKSIGNGIKIKIKY